MLVGNAWLQTASDCSRCILLLYSCDIALSLCSNLTCAAQHFPPASVAHCMIRFTVHLFQNTTGIRYKVRCRGGLTEA